MAERILVTGAAGFIGAALCRRLLSEGYQVDGVDSLNDYYDVGLKQDRLRTMAGDPGFSFEKVDLAESGALVNHGYRTVIHLAAQAGVRYSMENPDAYLESNLIGFHNVMEFVRKNNIRRFVYASSSSVYGNQPGELVEPHPGQPQSLYAATKRSNELVASTYSHLYGINTIGLRFFTVYGPWGRPDMAPMLFTKAMLAGKPIKLFNSGSLYRDFTYIDDIVEGINRVIEKPVMKTESRIFNIGRGEKMALGEFVRILTEELGVQPIIELEGMQPGDVYSTHADTTALRCYAGYSPKVSLAEGVREFVGWYKSYYKE